MANVEKSNFLIKIMRVKHKTEMLNNILSGVFSKGLRDDAFYKKIGPRKW